jgi:hypothetical protein
MEMANEPKKNESRSRIERCMVEKTTMRENLVRPVQVIIPAITCVARAELVIRIIVSRNLLIDMKIFWGVPCVTGGSLPSR